MYQKIGEWNPEYLLTEAYGATVISAPLKPGCGKLKRGQIIKRGSDGMYVAAGTNDITTSYFLAILDEDVDTDVNLLVAEEARAYTEGHFDAAKLIIASNGTLTAAHKLALRLLGIYCGMMTDDAPEFENGRVTITYVANNAADPAEADVKEYAVKGSTYTVAANSVTGFTPPASKSFSKWNTKADGTGTDYAAAASYTANAALTLYAVWAS